MDMGVIITIIPPILTAIFAYLIAWKRNIISEKMDKAKLDADIQSQALTIVKSVMNDMREELRREIEVLRKEKDALKIQIESSEIQIKDLRTQLEASDEIIFALKSQISILQSTIKLYEGGQINTDTLQSTIKVYKEEIDKLREMLRVKGL